MRVKLSRKEKEKTPFKSTVSMILQVHLMDQLN